MKTVVRWLLRGLEVLVALPLLVLGWAAMLVVMGIAVLYDWAESP